MSSIKILWAHPERNLFNQIAMFSVSRPCDVAGAGVHLRSADSRWI